MEGEVGGEDARSRVVEDPALLPEIISHLDPATALCAAKASRSCREAVSVHSQWLFSQVIDASLLGEVARVAGPRFRALRVGGLVGDEVARLAPLFPSLTSLDLSACGNLLTGDAMVAAVLAVRHTLEHLNLRGCSQVFDKHVAKAFRWKPDRSKLPLRSLDLKGCLDQRNEDMNGLSLKNVADTCPNLQSLKVGWLSEFDPNGGFSEPYYMQFQLVDVLSDVHPLLIEDPDGMSAIMDLAEYCPGLTCLDLSGCRNIPIEPLRALLRACTSLEHLNLNAVKAAMDYTLNSVSSSSLKSLNVRGAMPNFTGSSLVPLLRRNPRLERLNVSCCCIDGDTVRAVAESCPELRTLDVCYCSEIPREPLVEALRTLAKLEDLGCSHSELEAADLIEFARSHPGLRSIGFGDMDKVDRGEAVVEALRDSCPQLESVYLGNSSWVDDVVARALGAMPSMRSLCLNECSNVGDELRDELHARLPYAHREDYAGDAFS